MRFVSVVGAASCMVVGSGVQARRVGIGHWRMGGARTTVALRSGAPIQGVRNTTRAVDTAPHMAVAESAWSMGAPRTPFGSAIATTGPLQDPRRPHTMRSRRRGQRIARALGSSLSCHHNGTHGTLYVTVIPVTPLNKLRKLLYTRTSLGKICDKI